MGSWLVQPCVYLREKLWDLDSSNGTTVGYDSFNIGILLYFLLLTPMHCNKRNHWMWSGFTRQKKQCSQIIMTDTAAMGLCGVFLNIVFIFESCVLQSINLIEMLVLSLTKIWIVNTVYHCVWFGGGRYCQVFKPNRFRTLIDMVVCCVHTLLTYIC